MTEEPPAGRAAPRATYRLQLHAGFTCDDAAAIVPYLARLGVSHAYCSPLLRARRGSLHGYDVVDHDEINPELGGRAGLDRLVAALRAHGMGLIFDVVPNHMGVFGDDNAWWMDVLEHGPASAFATYFDIDWQPADADLAGKVLAPVLGDRYGVVLASGELVATFEPDSGSFAVRYHGHRFPVDPRDYALLLDKAPDPLPDLAREFAALPAREEGGARGERARLALVLKGRLAKAASYAGTLEAIEACAASVSADSEGRLHALLERQAWRLAYWKVAADGINYRRFFDINELAALRMEDEEVFEATHRLTLDLAAEGVIDGLRIDHPDGLHDPALYFERLQAGYARRAGLARQPAAGGRPDRPLWVVVEKIAAWHEDVPVEWAVHGTTGYRFATIVNGLFVDTAAASRLERIWQAFSGDRTPFEETCHDGKRAIQRTALASELTMLATELLRIARADLRSRDFTFNSLRETLREVAACLPVYRTYVAGTPSAQDLRYIEWAMAGAVRHGRETDPSVLAFVRETLTGRAPTGASPAHAARVRRFAMRFQQFTAPVAAKGVEDTAFYNYHRLVSLNEVGGEPSQFGFGVNAFHGASADRAARWPQTMLATSTHDNKRSEDVRQRINVLSEMAGAWRLELRRWRKLNRSRRRDLEGRSAPSAADEYLLYQVLLGTLPGRGLAGEALAGYRGRIEAYMTKAARESKRETSWMDPHADYERALVDFVRGALSRDAPNHFLDDIETQAETIAWYGALNSIAMTAIKFASPGVPDLYQGNELLDLSLVDPDNRRPVDYGVRDRLLAGFEAASASAADVSALLADPRDGRAKLWVTWRLLQLRRLAPGLLSQGDYRGLAIRGTAQRHGIAFHRALGDQSLVVVSGRLFAGVSGAPRLPLGEAAWGDTQVEFRRTRAAPAFVNVLTGERVTVAGGVLPLATALATFPVAVLVAGPGADTLAPGA